MSFKFDYQLFAINTTETMPDEIKTYYDDYLIDCSSPKLVHDQFGQKRPIPAGRGKTIEFRKVSPLPVSTTPLTEGVTPESQQLTISTVEAPVQQYGGYVELSDMVVLTAIDNNLVIAAKQLGAQAGKTLDAITREVLAGGTNVQYAEGQVTERNQLVGGKAEGNHYLTVDAVRRAVRMLAREIDQILMEPDGPVARRGDLVVLQVEELVGRHVVGQDIASMGFEHGGEDEAVEDDIILADEVDEARLRVLPPFLPRSPARGCPSVTHRRHLETGARHLLRPTVLQSHQSRQ